MNLASLWAAYEPVVQFVGLNAILGLSIYVTLAAGQLSLGQAAFMGIGAYVSALLTMQAGLPFPVVLLAGMVAAGLAALPLGVVVLRLRGVFLAIATLGFGAMLGVLLLNLPITGGAEGLRPIPSITTTPEIFLVLAVLAYGFWRLDGSTFGRALHALRDDEAAAATLGIDPVRTNVLAFVISATVAGLAGGLSAHLTYIITPRDFGFSTALDVLVYAIVGGTTSFAGPILGAALMTVLPELLRFLPLDPGAIELFVSGAILLLVILFLPGGLVSLMLRPGRAAGTGSAGAGSRMAPQTPPDRLATDAGPLLAVTGLERSFGGVRAVDGLDLTVNPGEVVGLIGPNGAGKTTVVNLLSGLIRPTRGTIRFAGRDVTGWRAHRIARLGLVRTFQNIRLFRHLSVLENVLVGLDAHGRATLLPGLLGRAGAEEAAARVRARTLLGRVGLEALADRPAASLSYGDRRRLEIARALAARPRLLVLDEPAAGMTAAEASRIGVLVRELAAEGLAILLIEHNVRMVMAACDRVAVVNFGASIAEGVPSVVARDPRVIDAYLGEAVPGD